MSSSLSFMHTRRRHTRSRTRVHTHTRRVFPPQRNANPISGAAQMPILFWRGHASDRRRVPVGGAGGVGGPAVAPGSGSHAPTHRPPPPRGQPLPKTVPGRGSAPSHPTRSSSPVVRNRHPFPQRRAVPEECQLMYNIFIRLLSRGHERSVTLLTFTCPSP